MGKSKNYVPSEIEYANYQEAKQSGIEGLQDQATFLLQQAYGLLQHEESRGFGSRELSVTLTNIDNAMLWREKDVLTKTLCSNLNPSKTKIIVNAREVEVEGDTITCEDLVRIGFGEQFLSRKSYARYSYKDGDELFQFSDGSVQIKEGMIFTVTFTSKGG
jgi:hypothetical protein